MPLGAKIRGSHLGLVMHLFPRLLTLALGAVLLGPVIGTLQPVSAASVTVKLPKTTQKGAQNINKASFDDLVNVPHFNPGLSRAVVDGRPWKSVDDLLNRKNYFDYKDQSNLKKALEEGYLFFKK